MPKTHRHIESSLDEGRYVPMLGVVWVNDLQKQRRQSSRFDSSPACGTDRRNDFGRQLECVISGVGRKQGR